MISEKSMELSEDTTVYVLTGEHGRFVGIKELRSERQWLYAFTSPDKAKTFLRMARQKGLLEKVNRLFPCTLAEWFQIREKHHFPDLAIDPDPEQHRDYPMLASFEPNTTSPPS